MGDVSFTLGAQGLAQPRTVNLLGNGGRERGRENQRKIEKERNRYIERERADKTNEKREIGRKKETYRQSVC